MTLSTKVSTRPIGGRDPSSIIRAKADWNAMVAHVSGWVNVKEAGAAGDGTTDDLPTLNSVVAAALAGTAPPHIVIPAGYYRVTGAWNIGLPEYDGYGFIVTRTTEASDALFAAHELSSNIASNAGKPALTIEFQEGAHIVADFAPSVPTPVISYNLVGENARTGAIINPSVIGTGSFVGGKYQQPNWAGNWMGPSNNLIGIYASRGVKVIQRPFLSSVQYGIVSARGYWTRIEDATIEFAAGDCVNVAGGNALTVENILMRNSQRGLIFDGGVARLFSLHTEQVVEDLTVFAADVLKVDGGYLEDSVAVDGTGKAAVRLGYVQNGLKVLQSTFDGLYIPSTRANKLAFRVWDCANVRFVNCRGFGAHGYVVDANSYGIVDSSDFLDDAAFAGAKWTKISPDFRPGSLVFGNEQASGINIKDAGGIARAAMWLNVAGIQKFAGGGILATLFEAPVGFKRGFPTYGTTIPIDRTAGSSFVIVATNGTGFTVANPTNFEANTDTQITIRIVNTSGGALGTLTWDSAYRLAGAWVQPGSNTNRSITFEFIAAYGKWFEVSRNAADVPN